MGVPKNICRGSSTDSRLDMTTVRNQRSHPSHLETHNFSVKLCPPVYPELRCASVCELPVSAAPGPRGSSRSLRVGSGAACRGGSKPLGISVHICTYICLCMIYIYIYIYTYTYYTHTHMCAEIHAPSCVQGFKQTHVFYGKCDQVCVKVFVHRHMYASIVKCV